MEIQTSDCGRGRQPAERSSQTDHEREAATSTSEAAQDGCTCGFCDGVTVEVGHDPRTGEVQSFERMSRRTSCPNCGGKNVQYRRSYTAHCAEVAREKGRTRYAYSVTLVLDRETADRAGIDGDESYQVLTGQRGVWTRSRRAVKRRDEDAQYIGTASARPSDGRWHVHVMYFTSLSRHELAEALHVTGADAYISTPDSESHEQFGARKGAYAFDNAAKSPSARFISSRGAGVGYDSEEAVDRRRRAAERQTGGRDRGSESGARSLSRNERRETGEETGDTEHEGAENSPAEAESDGMRRGRAPPVQCDGGMHDDLDAYYAAVKGTLTGRVDTRVYVRGLGNCRLLKVSDSDEEGLDCTVAPLDVEATAAVTVEWPQILAANEPLVSSDRPSRPSMIQSPDDDSSDTTENDPVDRFYNEARYSTVTTELDDGRRRVTVKDHQTGEMREHVKPPRDE